MRQFLRFLAASLMAASGLSSQPFSLKLSGLSDYWIPSGAVVQVPADVLTELRVRLGMPHAKNFETSDLKLDVDGTYPRTTKRLTGGDGHILVVTTREPTGLLSGPEDHKIEVETSGGEALHGQWTITHWRHGYVQATAAGQDGTPIQINLEQPKGVVLLPSEPGAEVRFRGEMTGGVDARLFAGETELTRLPGRAGFQFDRKIAISPATREFILRGEDKSGDVTVIMLSVVPPAK